MLAERNRQLERENGRLRSLWIIAEQRAERAEAQLSEAKRRIEQQEQRLQYLEMLVRSDSTNSSQPPSSDKPWKKPRKGRKKKNNGKRGGKKGHPGAHRRFVPLEEVDEVISHRPTECRGCQSTLPTQGGYVVERAQQTELPEMKTRIVEHQAMEVCCPCCQKTNRGELPKYVSGSCFGPRVHAWVSMLSGSFNMSQSNIRRLLHEQCGLQLSFGGVVSILHRSRNVLAGAVEHAHKQIQASPVAFADESTFRCQDTRPYLWSLSNHELSVFQILQGRSQNEAKQLLGDFKGLLHTDQYGGYNHHPLTKRQLCWAHIDRKLKALLEDTKVRSFVRKLRRALRTLFRIGRNIRDGTLPHKRRRRICAEQTGRLEKLWRRAHKSPCQPLRAMAQSLLKMKPAWCRFILIPGAEPTNNRSERALRHPVIYRKTSFGTQSEDGCRIREILFSVHHSLRLQKRSVYAFLYRSFEAFFQGRPQPLLTP